MKSFKKYITALLFLALPGAASAQDMMSTYEKYQTEIVLGFAVLVCFVALVALTICLYALMTVLGIKSLSSADAEEASAEQSRESFWRRLLNKMNDAVPVAQENKVITDHEYDGIRELDNKLPPWWVYMFYITIIFGIGYLLHFHVFETGELQEAEYETEMAEARASVEAYLASLDEIIDETTVTASVDEADLIKGQELYGINCAPCHGPDGGGTVGPNLTDKYWIHGGTVSEIFSTIKYGVPTKGMIAWESQLTPKQMQQLSSFIITLEGTTPANPKAPEGELFEREEQTTNQDVREEVLEDATDEGTADPEVPASLDGREIETEEE